MRGLGGHLVVLDAEALSTADIVIDTAHLTVPDDTGALVDLRDGRGWLRRLAPEDWRDTDPPGGHDAVVRSGWLSALVTIVRLSELRWLSPLDVLFAAEDKLAQQRACAVLEIRCPPMALVTRPEHIPSELGDHLVVKAFASGHFRDATGTGHVVYATEMHRSDDRLALLAGAPFLVQQRAQARAHLRIVTMNDRAWACELDAASLPVDWRADEAAHSSFKPTSHPGVEASAVALAARLGLGYSSQDWLIDATGAALFLDLNPAGQWLFLPDEVAAAVTSAIAHWLVGMA